MSEEQVEAPTVTSVVMAALRAADLPVSSLKVAQVADALLGAGCRIADVQRVQPDAEPDDAHDLAGALGIEPGSIEWHRMIERVRELREIEQRACKVADGPSPVSSETYPSNGARWILGRTP